MTLPSSGPLQASQINVELGRAAGTPIGLGNSAERSLAGVPSGPISFSSFYGKSAGGGGGGGGGGGKSATYAGTGTGGSGSSPSIGVAFGADAADRRIVCVIHWSAGEFARSISSATIAGVSASIVRQGTQSGGTTSHGVGIIMAAVPSGASGTVVVNFSGSVNSGTRVGAYRLSGGFTGAVSSDLESSETPTTNLSVSLPTTADNCIIAGFTANDAEFSHWGSGLVLTYGGGAQAGGFNSLVGAGTFNSGVTVTPQPTGGNFMVIAAFG